jgi:hypothetical protein
MLQGQELDVMWIVTAHLTEDCQLGPSGQRVRFECDSKLDALDRAAEIRQTGLFTKPEFHRE